MEIDGFAVIRRQAYEACSLTFSAGNKTHLLLQQPGMEIAYDFMPKGSAGFFYVTNNTGISEVNFILEGIIEIRDNGKTILMTSGDFFYQNGPSRYISFEVYADVKMFYINTRPDYEVYAQKVSELLTIMNKLQKEDGVTLDHCNRMKALCMGISHYVGFDQSQLDVLFYASQFHDIGNSKIPLDILIKPDKLTDAEMEIMKNHSQYTYEIILEYYGEEIDSTARNHHERLDGTGYPRQLKADEINLSSCIICVADAYDAMTTSAPYNIAISSEDAISELWRCSEIQFDGRVVQGLADYLEARKQYI